MRTGNWRKTILAALLAVMMILPSLAAIADDPQPQSEVELGDVEYIEVSMEEDGGGVTYVTDTDNGTIGLEPGASVTTGDVSKTDGGLAVDISSDDGQISVTVGKVTNVSENEESSGVAIQIKTSGENADVTFKSEAAAADGDAVFILNNGGKVDATIGAITAAGDGIILENYAATETTAAVDSVDVSASGDYADDHIFGVWVYGEGTVTMTVGDVSATTEDLEKKETYATTKGILISSDGKVSVDAGNINLITNDITGSQSQGLDILGENEAEISVSTENIASSATADDKAEEYGVNIGNNGNTTEVTTGDIDVTASGGNYAQALGVKIYNAGKSSEVTAGDIIATATGKNSTYATGINIEADNESDTSITVNSITATATKTETEDEEGETKSNCAAKGTVIAVGANSTVDLTVAEGGIVVEGGEDSVGIETDNGDGTIMIGVAGDIESTGKGINLYDQDGTEYKDVPYEEEIDHTDDDQYLEQYDGKEIWVKIVDGVEVYYEYYPDTETIGYQWTEKAADERKGGETVVTVTGDVTAETTAINLNLTEAASTMEVTVDGTAEGKEHAIVLSEDTIADNLTMTVWEVKPNEAGNIVERAEWVEPEAEEEEGTVKYIADKEAEKLIQYIIRIEDTSKDYIAAGSGATDFKAGTGETYKVAKEGEKVLVKLTIPEGKELVAAYWDKAKSEAGRLLQDSDGNYYLEIPRGGGVELSVTLKDIPKPEPEPEPQPESQPQPQPQPQPEPDEKKYSVAKPLLTAKDADQKIEISFYASRNFVVTMEDGSKERGTYRQTEGKIVLASGENMITIADEGTFTYTSQANPSLSYQFNLGQAGMNILLAVK